MNTCVCGCGRNITIKILKNWTPDKIAVIILKFEQMCLKDVDDMANSVDPDQTQEQSDLGLLCLPIPV